MNKLDRDIIDCYKKGKNSQRQTAEMLGVGRGKVAYILKKHDVATRSVSYGNHLRHKNSCDLSKVRDVLIGNLLGDGSVLSQSKYSAYFSLDTIHPEYAEHLINVYEQAELEIYTYMREYPEKTWQDNHIVQSKAYPSLLEIRKKWYPNGKKIVPRDLELTPRICLYWYLDDGCNKKTGGIILHTNGFTYNDVEFLVDKLEELGIEGNFRMNKTQNRPTIYISKKESVKFLEMLPYPNLECFDYKFE